MRKQIDETCPATGHLLQSKSKKIIIDGKYYLQLYLCLILFLFFIRWPRLLPILNPDYVAKKIIQAVLTDQVYLLLPRSMYLIAALKKLESFLPLFVFSLFLPVTALKHLSVVLSHNCCRTIKTKENEKIPFLVSFDKNQNCALQLSFDKQKS